MANIGHGSNNSIMHSDLYRTYPNCFARSVVVQHNITTKFLFIGHGPDSVWTHMIRTTRVQHPLFRVMLLLINTWEYQIIFWWGITSNNNCNIIFLDFLGTIFLPMTRFFAIIIDIIWINFPFLESFAFLLFLPFCSIGYW